MATPQRQQPPPPSGVTRQLTAAQAAAAVTAVVIAAELAILAALAASVAALLAGTLLYRAAFRRLRTQAWAVIAGAETRIRALLRDASAAARADVERVLEADLGAPGRFLPPVPPASVPRLHASLHNAFLAALADADRQFARIAAAVRGVPPGERRALAEALLRDLAATGLTGKTDMSGRNWNIGTYARAATAGAVAELHAALQMAAYRAAGIDVVLVTRTDPRPPCPRCSPYVGRLLSVTGRTAGAQVVRDAAGQTRKGTVKATVAEARAAGLLHIACRDTLTAWADGLAIPAYIPWGPGRHGPGSYPAGEERLALEREYRRAQREHAVALTPPAKAQASRRARRLRSHLHGRGA